MTLFARVMRWLGSGRHGLDVVGLDIQPVAKPQFLRCVACGGEHQALVLSMGSLPPLALPSHCPLIERSGD